MNIAVTRPAFAEQLERDRQRLRDEAGQGPEFAAARRHLTLMNPDQLAALHKDWPR